MPNIQWMKSDVPGADLKLALRSFRDASNIGRLHRSSHQPQIKGRTPISTTDSSETFTTM